MTAPKPERLPCNIAANPDPQRRNLALGILGAVGSAALMEACSTDKASTPAGEAVANGAQALTSATYVSVGSIAELKAYNPSPNPLPACVNVLGFATPGDGGGGLFFWDNWVPNSSIFLDDNIAIVITSTSGLTGGRWRRFGFPHTRNCLAQDVQAATSEE